jgi:UrcA family protein
MKTSRAASIAISLALALGALQAPVQAGESNDGIPAKSVDYSDLNLAKNAHVARLYGRIKLAASTVCRELDGKDAQRAFRFQQCVVDATALAVASVDSRLLAERHAAAGRVGILSSRVSQLNR